MASIPLTSKMRADVRPCDLFLWLQAAGFVSGLGEERHGELKELWW